MVAVKGSAGEQKKERAWEYLDKTQQMGASTGCFEPGFSCLCFNRIYKLKVKAYSAVWL